MRDLFDSRSREQYRLFLADILETMRRGTSEAPRPAAAPSPAPGYQHQPPAPSIHTAKKVTVIADHLREGSNLAAMIERFRGSFASRPELLTLEDARIKGGCLGCLQCGYANRCAYEDKDGFVGFFNEKVLGSDILVFAGQAHDRFLSSSWKTFMDRSFFRTHQPSMRGRHIAFLVSGHLTSNTREVLNAWIQMHEADLTDIVTDEQAGSSAVDAAITSVAERLVRRSENGTIRNRDFLGVGGTKVFRDEIWGGLRLVFRADHRFYRQHGTYDFPQRQLLRRIAVGLAAALINLPPFRRRFYADLRHHMVRRYQKHLGGGGSNGAT
jgi:multimeric flavodoxin WrbA